MTKLTYTLLESHVRDFFPNKSALTIARNANMGLREIHRDLEEVDRDNFVLPVPKTAGTVAITQDGNTVTGTGTAFASGDAGALIKIDGLDQWIEVLTFTSTTSIDLNVTWTPSTVTAATYTLVDPRFTFPTEVLRPLTIWQPNYDPLEKVMDEAGANDLYLSTDGSRPRYWFERTGGTDGRVYAQLVPPQEQRETYSYTFTVRPAYFDSTDGTSASNLPEVFDDAILFYTTWMCHIQEENMVEGAFWRAQFEKALRSARATNSADMGRQLAPARAGRPAELQYYSSPIGGG